MIYLLMYDEHPLDIAGRVKTHVKGYTTEKSKAEDFIKQNKEAINYGEYRYQEVNKINK